MSVKSECPYCGYTINIVTDRKCPNCGAPVPPDNESRQPVEEPQTQKTTIIETSPPKASGLGTAITAVWLVIVLLIGIAGFASFNSNFPSISTLPSGHVSITQAFLHIQYPSYSDNYLGPSNRSIGEGPATGGPPFRVQYGIWFPLSFNLSMIGVESHRVENVSVSTPGFWLYSVSPVTPYSMGPGSTVSFTVRVNVPSHEYSGPVTIILSTS